MSSHLSEQAQLLLILSSLDVGHAAQRRLLDLLREGRLGLAGVLGAGDRVLRRLGVEPDACRRLAALTDGPACARAIAARLDGAGVSWFASWDDAYPARVRDALKREAPPILFTAGDAAMLDASAGAIVGSRTPGRETARYVAALAREVAAARWVVVSGGARGIDSAAHQGALEAGRTAMVLPTGILRYAEAPAAQATGARAGEALCAVCAWGPDAEWSSAQAIGRNRLIAALSKWVVAADPRDHGGTWSTVRFALELRRPLFFVTDEATPERRRAARKLDEWGATRLDPARAPDLAEIERKAGEQDARPLGRQRGMFSEEAP